MISNEFAAGQREPSPFLYLCVPSWRPIEAPRAKLDFAAVLLDSFLYITGLSLPTFPCFLFDFPRCSLHVRRAPRKKPFPSQCALLHSVVVRQRRRP